MTQVGFSPARCWCLIVLNFIYADNTVMPLQYTFRWLYKCRVCWWFHWSPRKHRNRMAYVAYSRKFLGDGLWFWYHSSCRVTPHIKSEIITQQKKLWYEKCVPYKVNTLKWSQIWNTIIYYQTIFRSVLAIDEKHSSLWLHIFPGDGGAWGGYWLLSVVGGEFEKSWDICTRVSHQMINMCIRVFGISINI